MPRIRIAVTRPGEREPPARAMCRSGASGDRGAMEQATTPPRIRARTVTVTALSVVVLAVALVWIVAPQLGPYTENNPVPLQRLLPGSGSVPAAGVQAVIGAVGAAVGIVALMGRARGIRFLGVIGMVSGGIGALGFVGLNGVALAGYLLAAIGPALLIVLALVTVRHPGARIAVAGAAVAVVAFAFFGPAPIVVFYRMLFQALAEQTPWVLSALLLLAFSGLWILWGALQLRGEPGRFGEFVLRHRRATTVLATCCALPYAVARLSWLTPWPLFGGDAIEQFGTSGLITGLMLGAAMLIGGVLTLGLILPWGERVPRWAPGVGGRPVPVPLAVVPATIAAVLFTATGVETLLMLATPQSYSSGLDIDWTIALFLPFWLWGPLLGLATWGYAVHRTQPSKGESLSSDAPALRLR